MKSQESSLKLAGLAGLGKWAVIDIETTGIDSSYDEIIDVGFLEFDGTQLVKKYSSLVRWEGELSQFIQKLTGITNSKLKNAPSWFDVEPEVMELYGKHLIAHNSDFEKSFLEKYFNEVDDGTPREKFEDSLYYLAILFPNMRELKLERFINDWKIRNGEVHRGFEDSLDLLKVLLVATLYVKRDLGKYHFLSSQFQKYMMEDYWFYHFFSLEEDELIKIGEEIDFSIEEHLQFVGFKEEEVENFEEPFKKESFEFSSNGLKEIFQKEEKIRERLPTYLYRESQKNLATRVGQSFSNQVHALIQAPTGTGKTLGYLVPTALFSLQEEKQILISTGTKVLQKQAISKDVPILRKILGFSKDKLKVVRLVGSGNHLCELAFNSKDYDVSSFDQKIAGIYFASLFFKIVYQVMKIKF